MKLSLLVINKRLAESELAPAVNLKSSYDVFSGSRSSAEFSVGVSVFDYVANDLKEKAEKCGMEADTVNEFEAPGLQSMERFGGKQMSRWYRRDIFLISATVTDILVVLGLLFVAELAIGLLLGLSIICCGGAVACCSYCRE
jgi:hypothetical protein